MFLKTNMNSAKHFKSSVICLAFMFEYEILTSRIHIGKLTCFSSFAKVHLFARKTEVTRRTSGRVRVPRGRDRGDGIGEGGFKEIILCFSLTNI
jgi:hypothetical protein